jgi:hypothetical protein
VAKLNPNGSALVYSTYLGGSSHEAMLWGGEIAVDASGSAYVTGTTSSADFPTTGNALQPAPGSGPNSGDCFVTRLNADGSALVYSTYLGGSDLEHGLGIAVDDSGAAYVTGATWSVNFPTTANALQPASSSVVPDGYIAKLDTTASGAASLVYSTYLGGNGGDFAGGIAVDDSGSAYVTGGTWSANFPITGNAPQPAYGGFHDAFVTRLNATGSALIYSTYLGGSHGENQANQFGLGNAGIAVDRFGNAYVTGQTFSDDFPTTPNALRVPGPFYSNGFVAKLDSAGSRWIYSTHLGGSKLDVVSGIAVDATGNAYVTGWTQSDDFPVVGALQPAHAGGTRYYLDAFLSKLNPAGAALVYSTYLGGSGDDRAVGIALDASGSVYVTGVTDSTNFPTATALQSASGGSDDAFVDKIADRP